MKIHLTPQNNGYKKSVFQIHILDSAKKTGSDGLFAFGSSANASKTATFSFGKTPENKETTSDKSNNSDKTDAPGN